MADSTLDKNFRVTNNNAVDVHVGKRVRLRRTLLGMSQEQLGASLNITFQQVQKYERGANRISASRLWDISQILDVQIRYFFDDMTDDTIRSSPRRVSRGENIDFDDDNARDPMAPVKHLNSCAPIIRLKVQKCANVYLRWLSPWLRPSMNSTEL